MRRIDLQIDLQQKHNAYIRAALPRQKDSGGSSNQANPSPLDEEYTHSFMDPHLYRVVTTGDIDAFKLVPDALDREGLSLMGQETPQGNTILHLAAMSGYDQLVELILTRFPNLRDLENGMSNSALHFAAEAGHLSTVKHLVTVGVSDELNTDMLASENDDGDYPLHLALKNSHKEVAMFLVESNPQVVCLPNRENKSPLYMAAEAGYLELVKVMVGKQIGGIVYENRYNWPRVKSVLHAAIAGKNIDILDIILCKDLKTINGRDEVWRSPLSYAAFMGYLEGVVYFLEKYTQVVYQADPNGFFPIHIASAKGNITIIEKFLQHYPDSIELLNTEGQNILHVAAMRGKYNLVSYLLKLHVFEKYINERDAYGNTPLHLATIHWHPKVVTALTWDNRVNLKLVNVKGLTALDAAEESMGTSFSYRKIDLDMKLANDGPVGTITKVTCR